MYATDVSYGVDGPDSRLHPTWYISRVHGVHATGCLYRKRADASYTLRARVNGLNCGTHVWPGFVTQNMAKLRLPNRPVICLWAVVPGFPRPLSGHGTCSLRYPGWLSRRNFSMLTRLMVLLKDL